MNHLDDDQAILKWVEERATKHSAEAVEEWNQSHGHSPSGHRREESAIHAFLKEAGGEGRKDIKTYFDLIEFDEGRLK